MQNNSNPGINSKQLQAIIDQVIKVLKVQVDRRRDNTVRGSQVINPQNLVTTNPTIYGPYYFGTLFQKAPYIAFGDIKSPNQPPGFLVVKPYVDSWVSTSGGVNGFNLGIYAITSVPAGWNSHTISWVAVGKASLYKANNTNEKWNSAYNLNQATNLIQTDGSLEKSN